MAKRREVWNHIGDVLTRDTVLVPHRNKDRNVNDAETFFFLNYYW